MATTTILVMQLTGQVWMRDAAGNLIPLREGMRIPADANIVTASGSTVQLQADGQPPLILGERQYVALAPELFEDIAASEAAVPVAADPMAEQLIAAINAGQDPLAILEPAATTLSGGGGGGSTFVRLTQVLESTAPLNLAYPRSVSEVPEDRRTGEASTTVAATPEAPNSPTTPVDPIDPTTPTTPVEPTDPTTPTTPVDPTSPTTPTTPVDPTDPTTPTTPVDPTDPTTPTTPVEPTDPATPVGTAPKPAISLVKVGVEHWHQTVTETTYIKGSVTIAVNDGKVSVDGIQLVEPEGRNTVQLTVQGALNLVGDLFNGVTNAHGHTEWSTTGWPPVLEPKDLLVLSKSLDHYDLSGLVGNSPGWSGLIVDKDTGATVNIAFFAGIVFGDGNISYLPGFEAKTTTTTSGYDQVTLDLDVWVAEKGDVSDKLSNVTISGLGDVAVASIQYQGHTLVVGTDYTLKNGVLTLVNGAGMDMKDVQLVLQVPVGHAPLNLQAEVTASNGYGSHSTQGSLTVDISHAATEPGGGTGGDGGGADDHGPGMPVVNKPTVHMDVSSHTVDTTVSTPKDPLVGTTAVNGGALDPSGNGFNLDAAGNVVAIGFNVRVWGTESNKGPDGKTPIHDFANGILVYKDGSFSAAQFGVNLIRYGYETKGQANANAAKDHADNTDLFLLHSQSGFWAGNGNKPDGEKGSWQSFSNFTGNSGKLGSTAPDYVVLIGDAAQGAVLDKPISNNGNNGNNNANVLESVSITMSTGAKVVNGGNRVEGVIAGGELLVAGHGNLTTLEKVVSAPDTVTHDTVYDVAITASLPTVAGSEAKLHAELVLKGIPVGAKVSYQGAEVPVGADGKITILGEISADGHTVLANLSISQVQDGHFTLTAHVQASNGLDASSTMADDDAIHFQTGTEAAETLLGSEGRDLLFGGGGYDLLVGGGGDDRLVWLHGDQGTVSTPAVDVVKDFGNGHDVLDLSDLLQGENASNLGSYLGASAEMVNGKASTVLYISSSGQLGADGASGADQKIVLEGQQLDTSDQAQLVQDLISQGKLHVDQ